MKILIVYNNENCALSIAQDVYKLFKENNVDSELLEFSEIMNPNLVDDSSFSSYDFFIIIGGDGTIIKAAKLAAIHDIPVIGINAGHLGYLASVNPDNLDSLLRLISGDYSIENRIIIKAEKIVDGICTDSCEGLNDIVICKNALSNLINVSITIGCDNIMYRADGIIAATPTGSTAYSMSAGGPVIDPTLDCIVITPVCPHTLLNRSLVIDAKSHIMLNVSSKNSCDIMVACDGRPAFELDENNTIKISISDLKAKFIKFNNSSVYKVFYEKTNLF